MHTKLSRVPAYTRCRRSPLCNLIKEFGTTSNWIRAYISPFARGTRVEQTGSKARRCLYPRFYRPLSGPEPFLAKENHPITDRCLSRIFRISRLKERVHRDRGRGRDERGGRARESSRRESEKKALSITATTTTTMAVQLFRSSEAPQRGEGSRLKTRCERS